MRQADVEQNNVKGEKRFFLPRLDEIVWDEAAQQLTIPFEYRPLTDKKNYGQKNQQEAIIASAVAEIPKRVEAAEALAALTAERPKNEKGETVSYLEHHLRQYTRRNTSDFFIHKDLKGFLSRELDFYLKNEVLNLDKMEAAGEHLAQGWFQLIRLIKRVGLRIIEFLAQIEDFQKMLWEKRKFVTETFYCITIGNIPESFYEKIAACEAQWDEWKSLFAIDELPKGLLAGDLTTTEGRIAFLKAHPTLVLDTRHFPADFTDRLLASFDNLDEMTDGLLVHSENWQALNLLQEKYRERVKCIYIDPPYNTGKDEFLYRDIYQHSSWLAMMENRTRVAFELLVSGAPFLISVDEMEQSRLEILLQQLFTTANYLTTFVWEGGRKNDSRLVSISHEYIECFVKDLPRLVEQQSEWKIRKRGIDEIYRKAQSLCRELGNDYREISERLKTWLEGLPDNHPAKRHKHYWAVDERGVYFPSDIGWHGGDGPKYEVIHPITGKPCKVPERGWMYPSPERMADAISKGLVHFWDDHTRVPCAKAYLKDNEFAAPNSVFYVDRRGASKRLRQIVGRSPTGRDVFENPKDEILLSTLFEPVMTNTGVVLDFFAGSGTTGHAVINLNREDGGRRKFILVEMAQYFDTVLLPRIKKVTFTPEWKDGKPKRMATQEEAERSPRIVKVIRLESYEDALNNLTFDEESGQQALELFRDDYLLSYMLKWETRHSETLLNVEKLQSPFSYKLHIHRDGETRERTVDLPETFNYLLGLDVHTRRVYDDEGRRYLVYRGTLRNSRTVAVIWRDTKDWKEKDYRCERNFVEKQKLVEGADEIYTNGDSIIPGARSLDGLFKARMFAPAEV